MKRILSWTSGLFFVLAVILFAFGVRVVTLPDREQPSIVAPESGSEVAVGPIDPPTISVDLGQVGKKSLTHFEVKLTNFSLHLAKIVGTPSTCVRAGCVVVDNPPKVILPNETATLRLICEAQTAGSLLIETSIYFDFGSPNGVSVPITVIATVVDSVQKK